MGEPRETLEGHMRWDSSREDRMRYLEDGKSDIGLIPIQMEARRPIFSQQTLLII